MKIKVRTHGPVFDGRAKGAVKAFMDEAEKTVAQRGLDEVKVALGTVLKNPTGHYRSRVVTDRQAGDSVINDGGVIYGPWLEGTSSRNTTTRFKGYTTFRKVTQRLDKKVDSIVQPILRKYLGRM